MEIRDRVVELRRVRARNLVPNPKNWRRHPTVQADAQADPVGDLIPLGPALPQTPAATTSWIAVGPGGGFPSGSGDQLPGAPGLVPR